MDWHAFHLICAVIAIVYAVWDMRPLVGRQFIFGAEIHLAVIMLSWLARQLTGDISPVALYGLIDIAAVSCFAIIMARKKAIWAAVCTVAHSIMLALHFAFYIGGQVSDALYLWMLGVLTFIVFAAIVTGTAAGRHEFGRKWDNFLATRLRGWSWSASFEPRIEAYKRQVA